MSDEYNDLSFDTTIPSAILVNENIELTAVKLYAFIKGLTKKHGYCFATNEYLAKLMKSTTRSVQKWLIMLKKEGYLEIETSKSGIQWQRLIYLSDKFKKSLRREFQFTPPRISVHSPTNSGSPITKDYSISDNSKGTPPSPLKVELELYGKFVQLTKESLISLIDQFGRVKVLEVIEEINDYLASTGKKPYKDYAATIRNWMRRRKQSEKPQESKIDENKEITQRVLKSFANDAKNGFIRESLKGIEFVYGNFYLLIGYEEPGFRDKLESQLRKMNLPTTGL